MGCWKTPHSCDLIGNRRSAVCAPVETLLDGGPPVWRERISRLGPREGGGGATAPKPLPLGEATLGRFAFFKNRFLAEVAGSAPIIVIESFIRNFSREAARIWHQANFVQMQATVGVELPEHSWATYGNLCRVLGITFIEVPGVEFPEYDMYKSQFLLGKNRRPMRHLLRIRQCLRLLSNRRCLLLLSNRRGNPLNQPLFVEQYAQPASPSNAPFA